MGRGQADIKFEEIERFGFDDGGSLTEPPPTWYRITGKAPVNWNGELWQRWFEEMMQMNGEEIKEPLELHYRAGDTIVLRLQAISSVQALAYAKRIIETTLEIPWLAATSCYQEA